MKNYRLRKGSIQYQFHNSRQKIQIFGGAYGNGKTTALAIKALKLASHYPGSNGLLARSTYPKLNDTLRKVVLDWCPPEWIKRRPTADDNTMLLVNGSTINFRYVSQRGKHTADGSSTSNTLSASYDWVGVDQVEDPEIGHKDIMDLMGRLRGDTPYRPPEGEYDDPTMPDTGPRWMMLTSNPTANWFFKELVHPYLTWKNKGIYLDKLVVHPETKLPIIDLFEGDIYTNRDNLEPDYIQGLEAMYQGQMRERFLLGKWAAFEGLVHPAFELQKHTLTRDEAEEYLEECLARHMHVRFIESFDFGLVSPSCYMFAMVDDKGRVIVLDGYHKREFNYSEQPDAVEAIRDKYRNRYGDRYGLKIGDDRILADPSIFRRQVVNKTRDTGDTVAKLLDQLGMRTRPATNDIIPGIAKVNAYLGGLPWLEHIVTREAPSPLLYVLEEFEWFLDEIVSYYWKRDAQGKSMDEPQDWNDHAMNALKYLLAFLPEPSKIVIPKSEQVPQYMYWHEVQDRAF